MTTPCENRRTAVDRRGDAGVRRRARNGKLYTQHIGQLFLNELFPLASRAPCRWFAPALAYQCYRILSCWRGCGAPRLSGSRRVLRITASRRAFAAICSDGVNSGRRRVYRGVDKRRARQAAGGDGLCCG